MLRIGNNRVFSPQIIGPDTLRICLLTSRHNMEEEEATGRLISAAPELFAALEAGIKWHDEGPCWCPYRRKLAASAGKKIHTKFCRMAKYAMQKVKGVA